LQPAGRRLIRSEKPAVHHHACSYQEQQPRGWSEAKPHHKTLPDSRDDVATAMVVEDTPESRKAQDVVPDEA